MSVQRPFLDVDPEARVRQSPQRSVSFMLPEITARKLWGLAEETQAAGYAKVPIGQLAAAVFEALSLSPYDVERLLMQHSAARNGEVLQATGALRLVLAEGGVEPPDPDPDRPASPAAALPVPIARTA